MGFETRLALDSSARIDYRRHFLMFTLEQNEPYCVSVVWKATEKTGKRQDFNTEDNTFPF